MREQPIATRVIARIKAKLEEPESRRLDKILLDLNQKHKLRMKLSGDGFLYAGRHELPKFNANKMLPKGQLKGLCPELFDEMEKLISARKDSELNISFCTQILYRIISSCHTLQEIRDALPDHVWALYEHPEHIERQRPELWTIQHDPKLLWQYAQFEQIMAILLVGRIMY